MSWLHTIHSLSSADWAMMPSPWQHSLATTNSLQVGLQGAGRGGLADCKSGRQRRPCRDGCLPPMDLQWLPWQLHSSQHWPLTPRCTWRGRGRGRGQGWGTCQGLRAGRGAGRMQVRCSALGGSQGVGGACSIVCPSGRLMRHVVTALAISRAGHRPAHRLQASGVRARRIRARGHTQASPNCAGACSDSHGIGL